MKVALFDMDGTLTESRQKMDKAMCFSLAKLQKSGFKVGIVTGSDIEYVLEQLSIIFETNSLNFHEIDFWVCNGTKYYTFSEEGKRICHYEKNMLSDIDEGLYRKLMMSLTGMLKDMIEAFNFPMTGNFIDVRGTMINFCPIGRNASKEQRDKWIEIDKKFMIRSIIINKIQNEMRDSGLSFKKGGDTSIDIYPEGWDKTFVFDEGKRYTNDSVYFFGDRCAGNGNDKEIYDYVKEKYGEENAREVSSPNETIEAIDRIIEKENENIYT